MNERLQRIKFTYYHPRPRLKHPDSQVGVLPGDQLVWWRGPIWNNDKARSIPLAQVWFRQLINDVPGPFFRAVIPLSSLPHYRVGTIWREGLCVSDTNLASNLRDFEVDFDEGRWSTTSRSEQVKSSKPHSFRHDDYPLKHKLDLNRLIDFKLPDGKNLLVPCAEYYIRAYARNMDACRVLVTLTWTSAMSYIFDDPNPDAHRWLLNPSQYMRFYDAVFLAHLLYDPYAAHRIRDLNSQFVIKKPQTRVFVDAGPWFRGKAKLQCQGRWINGGKTFLCLNLLGSSQPQGQEIEWLTKKFDSSDGKEGGQLVMPRPVRTAEAEEFIEECSFTTPDGHSQTIIVKPPPFKILGEKRRVKKKKVVLKTDRGRLGPHPSEADSYSSGDATGTGKNVGKLEHGAEAELETHGFLNDIWNAFRSIMADNPGRVTSLSWYTPPKFQDNTRPNLIALLPFIDCPPEDLPRSPGWVYLDKKTGKRRGLMVLRIQVDGESYFCIEVQPNKPEKAEFSGALMKSHVSSMEEFEEFIQQICSQVRRVAGRFINMESFFPPGTKIFKHHQKDAAVLYRSRLISAFRDVGVALK